ncbi:MAG: ABC transporter permease subunit [Candidatus Saccharibacteria bacterium]
MFNSIVLKTLYEKRWSLLGWFTAVTFVAYITMVFFPSLSNQSIDQVVGSVPDSLKGFIGNTSDYNTINGFIAQQLFGPNMIILTIVMSIILFLSVSSGDEERGSLKTLVTYPVSRRRVLLEKFFAIFIIIGIVSFGIVIGALIGLLQIGEHASILRLLQSALECWFMNVAYGAVGFGIAFATGSRGLSIAVASGYAFISITISSLAAGVDKLKTIDHFSIYHYYNNPQIMNHGISLNDFSLLLVIIIATLLVAYLGFRRRDIKG